MLPELWIVPPLLTVTTMLFVGRSPLTIEPKLHVTTPLAWVQPVEAETNETQRGERDGGDDAGGRDHSRVAGADHVGQLAADGDGIRGVGDLDSDVDHAHGGEGVDTPPAERVVRDLAAGHASAGLAAGARNRRLR